MTTRFGLLCLLFAPLSHAQLITFDPDDFPPGTELNFVSPYVQMATTHGEAIYPAPIGVELPSGPFGNAVFSRDRDSNSEWCCTPNNPNLYSSRYISDEWTAGHPNSHGLELYFYPDPATYVSILGLEIGDDSQPNDYLSIFVYNSDWDLIHYDEYGISQGSIGQHPYYLAEFSHPDISIVIFTAGSGEPITLDRLQFIIGESEEEPVEPGDTGQGQVSPPVTITPHDPPELAPPAPPPAAPPPATPAPAATPAAIPETPVATLAPVTSGGGGSTSVLFIACLGLALIKRSRSYAG